MKGGNDPAYDTGEKGNVTGLYIIVQHNYEKNQSKTDYFQT